MGGGNSVRYKKVVMLGQGNLGETWQVENQQPKILRVAQLIHANAGAEETGVLEEAKRLQAYIHPNIVQYIEGYKDPNEKKILLVTELCSGITGASIQRRR